MSNDETYQPISCALHSEYELAIMHKQTLHLSWKDEHGNIQSADVMPTNIQTANHQEFLVAKTADNEQLTIRLDHILEMEVV